MKKIFLPVVMVTAFIGCAPDDDDIAIPANDLTGTWTVSEKSTIFNPSAYKVTVEEVSSSQLRFINFYQLGTQHSVNVNISGSTLTIPQQSVSGHTIEGSGSIKDENELSLNYTANDGSEVDSVSAVFTR